MKKLFLLFANTIFSFTFLFAQMPGQSAAQGNLSQYLNKTLVENTTKTNAGNIINAFNNEENTVGKRFLFDEWVAGDSVIDTKGNLINTTAFIFNFDKLTGSLLATQDKLNNMLIASNGIQSFILKSRDKKYVFTHVNTITPNLFFLELVKSHTHYTLYKRFVTKYIAANYRTDGIVETGNNYNEYKDESEFYIIDGPTNVAQAVSLKPKAIKLLFAAQKEKVNSYFKQYGAEEIDEKFLTGLVSYLNQSKDL